jgi:hypothetical protein
MLYSFAKDKICLFSHADRDIGDAFHLPLSVGAMVELKMLK